MSFASRTVIHFLWSNDLDNTGISHVIDSVDDEEVIGLTIIRKWSHCFGEGDHGLEDERRTGRPRLTEHIGAISARLADDPYFSHKIMCDSQRSCWSSST
jgi:hypothetical protein